MTNAVTETNPLQWVAGWRVTEQDYDWSTSISSASVCCSSAATVLPGLVSLAPCICPYWHSYPIERHHSSQQIFVLLSDKYVTKNTVLPPCPRFSSSHHLLWVYVHANADGAWIRAATGFCGFVLSGTTDKSWQVLSCGGLLTTQESHNFNKTYARIHSTSPVVLLRGVWKIINVTQHYSPPTP